MEPKIYMPDISGYHNNNMDATIERLRQAKSYQDLSTVIICPTRGTIHVRVLQSWLGLMRPMNQKVVGPLFGVGMEVGDSYNQMIANILTNPGLADFKYILTLEEDNSVPMDGLLKLYENMDKYDGIGGLYFTKGYGGQPMCYGNPAVMPRNFIPQIPTPNSIVPCNGLGMGFTLYKMEMFKKIPAPWFQTVQRVVPGKGAEAYTQDLKFCEIALGYGYKFACDTRVLVGHYDAENDKMW